jgi:lysophospholipase L1-like esterase
MLKLWLIGSVVIAVTLVTAIMIHAWFYISEKIKISEELVKKSAAPYTQKLLQSETRILILGDSTAAGVGARDVKESVAGRFGADFPGAYIINQGVPGRDLRELLNDFPRYPTKHLKLALVMVGANDIIRFTKLSHIKRDINAVLEKATLMADNVLFLHSGNIGTAPFFPKTIGWLMSARTRQVRNIYKEAAARFGAIYVDLYASRSRDPFLKDIGRFYAPDGLHLTGEGYKIWYEKIRAAMTAAGINL